MTLLCSFVNCNKPAIWKHTRSAGVFCDRHYKVNQEKFFGYFTCIKIKNFAQQPITPDAETAATLDIAPKKV